MQPPINIGILPEAEIRNFARFCDGTVDLLFGNKLPDDKRLVMCPGDQATHCASLFQKFTGADTITPVVSEPEALGLGDVVEKALTAVGITKQRVSQWLGRECNCTERQMKLNRLGEWATSWFKGEKNAPPIPPSRTVVGCVHEGEVDKFREYCKEQNIPGMEFGHRPNDSSHRRVVDTLGHAERLREAIVWWNQGTDRPTYDTPYVPATWSYAITTVPQRLDDLSQTLSSLKDAGFADPVINVDGKFQYGGYVSNRPIGTFKHWHRTLLDLYSRNPWSQYYAIFQDDMIAVRNLRQYIELSQIPQKCYLNLFTFMENESIVRDRTGWVEAHRSEAGHQMGRGAVALVLPHDAVEDLLSSKHFITRRRDAIRGNRSLDGAVVEALNEAGYTEYVHAPSLVQHTGEVSSMGNPWSTNPADKRYAFAQTFPGKDFDALSFLRNPCPNQ